MNRPLIIGLTGSIGMGKSAVAAMFEAQGVPVFDADAEVRRMQGPGGALLGAIEAAFPGSTGPEGVDRDALGKHVFGNPEELGRLEAIMHPAVAERRAEFLAANADAPLVVFDIPLLFEKGGEDMVDVVIVVSAPHHVQRERVLARPAMTAHKFEKILDLQTPDHHKRARADHVIHTGVPIAETEAEVAALVERLMTESQSRS
ncbi:dephospho-CoA kinase [Citromicrobium bathyomarinum]|jgi:dephospho-CoA kinase|uniref:dephospho-CoA kinase n=1 Tax=Sphingomonadales TaxID=204457 RepID=UPI000C66C2DA|nr:dephospho-CoA kinase [Citromicrobium sp.]MBO80820.1 dephospho-CoA kinase [Citromicrobium sp.]|tara:strand:- start:36865 stop:37473 length:609 start_codon:yes stop_codon:yes gene_type:complete